MFRAGEAAAYFAGVVLCVFFGAQLALGEAQRGTAIREFERTSNATDSLASDLANSAGQPAFDPSDAGDPNTALWAPQRIVDYQDSMRGDVPRVLGVLEVPSVGLKVPVYPSDSELNMDRGAGIIDGMSYPHEGGNIGIAGHRDGYFRVLKDVQPGDALLLQTLEGPKRFTIDAAQVIEISDTWVLEDTQEQTVTLVTCYPFYFVGDAPQRFVVTASLDTTNVNQY